jgi:hypothetical protein
MNSHSELKDSTINGTFNMKARPKFNPRVWVNVIHTNKTIQFFLNEGGPIRGDGSFMSLEYFNVYKESHTLNDYRYTNTKYDMIDKLEEPHSSPSFLDDDYIDDDYDY